MNTILEFKHKTNNEVIEIVQDEDPASPREWDNLGVIFAKHPRYDLGDKAANEEDLELAKKNGVVLNLYLYDHSGLSLSTSNASYPFNDRWDSMQIGYIYATKEKILKEYSAKILSAKLRSQVIKVLQSEIEVYNQYLSGSVYGYIHSKIETCSLHEDHKTHLDSCYGFYYDDPKEVLGEVIPKEQQKDWV